MKLYGALEAGGTKMVCAIGDENGNIIEQISIPTKSPEETMPEMISFFKKKNICALGIGCFGPIDLNEASKTYGYITSTPKLAWQNYPIVQEFSQSLGIPIGFDTDVNASALGEATWGCTKAVANSIYITIGTGIGVGVIIDHKPYHGMMHPEGGHILLAPHKNDPMQQGVCPYHTNCFEGYASGPSIEKRWGAKAATLSSQANVWELEAYYIGHALCNYIMILSPERIVLGGGVMHQPQLLPLIRLEVEKQLSGYIQNQGTKDLENYIVAASLNDNQGIMGAIQLAINAIEKEHIYE